MIVPTNDGKVYAAADAAEWEKSPARWSWPMSWEAALLIAQSNKGCLGLWADKVRIVIEPRPGSIAALTKLVPPDTMVAFTSQGWLRGWNTGEMHRKGENYHPNWPLDNPVRWEGVEGFLTIRTGGTRS